MEHHNHNHNHNHNHSFPLPSPNSTSSSSSSPSPLPSPTTLTRPDPSSPYPTTFVQADTTSFKHVVQLLTGSKPNPNLNPNPKQQTQTPPINPTKTRPATKLYERRTTSRISPLLPTPAGHPHPHSHSPRNVKQSPLSPTMLNFPGLMLSPVTPLIHDPFNRSSSCSPNINVLAEEKAIAQKCFFLHPVSPVSDAQPRLLPLFPLSSPKVSSSSTSH